MQVHTEKYLKMSNDELLAEKDRLIEIRESLAEIYNENMVAAFEHKDNKKLYEQHISKIVEVEPITNENKENIREISRILRRRQQA